MICIANGCTRDAWAKSYCSPHYARYRRHGNPLAGGSVKGRGRTECSVDGCEGDVYAHHLCNPHYQREKRHGSPTAGGPLRNPKGSGHTDRHGYRYQFMPSHPNAYKNGKVPEHVIVMSEALGRPLHKGETVHHLNGIRTDNRIENLELWAIGQPAGQRVADMIAFCLEFLTRYQGEPHLWPPHVARPMLPQPNPVDR